MEEINIGSVKTPNKPPFCLRCSFYRVTWDSTFPHACDIFAIKSAKLPSMEVFRATGANCPSYKLKDGLK